MTTTPAPDFNIDLAMAHSHRLSRLVRRTQEAKARVHAGMRDHLIAVRNRYVELFEPLVDGLARECQGIDHRHFLDSWSIEGDTFTANLSYGFRGEVCYYEVELPLRYVQPGGEQAMQRDLEALRAAMAHSEATAQAAKERRERRELQRLLSLYPPGAAGAPEGPANPSEGEPS